MPVKRGQQPKGGRNQDHPTRIAAAEKRRKGLSMLKAGATWSQIAAECGWSNTGTAYGEVMRELRDIPAQEARDLRALHHERLSALFMATYPAALRGDGKAVERCLLILERESKLLGLDAPQSIRVEEVPTDVIENKIRTLEEDNARRAAALSIPATRTDRQLPGSVEEAEGVTAGE
jgi:hypothetical protein